MVIPQAIVTDINCGTRLLTIGITQEQAVAQLAALERRLIRLFLVSARNHSRSEPGVYHRKAAYRLGLTEGRTV